LEGRIEREEEKEKEEKPSKKGENTVKLFPKTT
jgi:hypothetical protein